LADSLSHLASRQESARGKVCVEHKGPMLPERELELRLTRPPPAGEAIPNATWQDRPSFVLGEDPDGTTLVYASLQPGDQITVVQITGGPRFVEQVDLLRTGRSLRWRRDHKGESLCYEVPPLE
jgi:hypothetical protein